LLLLLGGVARAETIAIEGATIHIRPGEVVEGATVIIEDGRIGAVGQGVKVPGGARRIDGRGKVITAGLIDGFTELGLVEVDLVAETNEGSFSAADDTVHAAYRVTDGYNPASVAIPVVRSGGVTSVASVPRGALVSGTSALVSLKSTGTTEALTRKAPLGMHATLGRGALPHARGSRGMALERLREVLDDAVQFGRRKGAYERNQTRDFAASRLDLEALLPVVRGQLPLFVNVDRAADVRAALRVARDLRLRLVVVGGAEAWQVADELAQARVPVILNPVANLPANFDALHVRDDGAALLRKAGVTVAISTLAGFHSAHRLRQAAGTAVAHGLPWADALAAITSAPAEIFGMKGLGAVRTGAVADVVVWSGDPLELSSRPLHVFIDGVEQPLKHRQSKLLDRYRRL
jgi:imidazolonepropionase-like amidohydrolase